MLATQLRDETVSWVLSVTGIDEKYLNEFEYRVGQTTLSSIYWPVGTVILYCVGIPLLQHFMKDRQPPPLKWIIFFHNCFLCIVSGFLGFLLTVTILSLHESGVSVFNCFCNITHFEQQGLLTLIYYVNHLLKYYELLDTIFLALKKKNIGFLHGYHHPATLVLTWGQIVDSTGIQWLVIVLDLYVHTIMYFYYGLASLRIRMPFKKIVTILQILQFVMDLCACYYATGYVLLFGQCYGAPRAAYVGCFILTSYLYLFVDFYNEAYSKKKVMKKHVKQA